LTFVAIGIQSCDYFPIEEEKELVLAEVGDEKLVWDKAKRYVPAFFTTEDSVQKVERYIDSWITNKLLISTAKTDGEIDFDALDVKVNKLKEDLIIHEYNSNYIRNNLDTAISLRDVEKYYIENRKNFILKEKVIKGSFIKIRDVSPLVPDVRKAFASKDTSALVKLKEMSQSQATNYLFSEDNWISLKSILSNVSFLNRNEIDKLLLRKELVKEYKNDIYFIRINEIKNEQDIAPLEIKMETVKSIILNERKLHLIESLKDTIYSNAKKGEFKRL